MKIFITRVWGFDPKRWPIITFNLEGNRDRLLRESSPGDRIVIVGTLREPTPEPMRGRLLGMAEIGRIPVETLDVIGDDARGPQDYDESGQFRWPKAIPMVEAWQFTPQPLLLDVLQEQLPYHATSQAVALSEVDANAVLKLKNAGVELPEIQFLKNAKLLDQALGAKGPTTGPKPKSWSAESSRDVDRPSFTYAFRFGSSDIWKIGHTIDVNERLKQVNCHIPVEVVHEQWNAKFQQRWESEVSAHAMEQRVLKSLSQHRTDGERVKCSEQVLWQSWLESIGV